MQAKKENHPISQIPKAQYLSRVQAVSPPSDWVRHCGMAFLFGGGICVLGESLWMLYRWLGAEEEQCPGLVAITLIGLSAFLTGLRVFDRIALYAGAGTLVPITGFANAMTAPAMEFKSEGFVLGVGAKMFVIAGPVLVYGLTASGLYGLVLYLVRSVLGGIG